MIKFKDILTESNGTSLKRLTFINKRDLEKAIQHLKTTGFSEPTQFNKEGLYFFTQPHQVFIDVQPKNYKRVEKIILKHVSYKLDDVQVSNPTKPHNHGGYLD